MITSVDFNGAHWRLTIAGETAGLWSQEQEAKHRAAAVATALEKRDEAFRAAALQERGQFLDVIAKMQIEEREMADAMGRLQAAAKMARAALEAAASWVPIVHQGPQVSAALEALNEALEGVQS